MLVEVLVGVQKEKKKKKIKKSSRPSLCQYMVNLAGGRLLMTTLYPISKVYSTCFISCKEGTSKATKLQSQFSHFL
jgi:hypothetical protein